MLVGLEVLVDLIQVAEVRDLTNLLGGLLAEGDRHQLPPMGFRRVGAEVDLSVLGEVLHLLPPLLAVFTA